ncbi:MAG: hypothetical protein WC655_02785 [Candidatus Hydrogenedentales bacterium]|jgi:hypothetical protein
MQKAPSIKKRPANRIWMLLLAVSILAVVVLYAVGFIQEARGIGKTVPPEKTQVIKGWVQPQLPKAAN